jgi:DNA-binding protein
MPEKAVVAVGAKRTREYVLSCLSLFNRGRDEVELVSVGDSISKAAEVSRLVAQCVGIEATTAEVSNLRRGKDQFTRLAFRLRFSGRREEAGPRPAGGGDYVNFATYHLLLDHLLTAERELLLGVEGNPKLLRIQPTDSGFQCSLAAGGEALLSGRRGADDANRRDDKIEDMAAALYRAGFVLSGRWEEIGSRLGQFDDVVLGLDTNILYNCAITQQLLDAVAFTCPPSGSPNWILLVVPKTVMHEVEQAANSRDDRGQLDRVGRKGYRALEEILELDQSRDIRGVSLLIVGEADPVLDARVELRGLREDFRKRDSQQTMSRKTSNGDTLIRDQFKAFLRQLSFHKGTFFLTADKSNSALGQAEGLHSIYFPPANGKSTINMSEVLLPPHLSYEGERLTMAVPVGKLIYEMAVQFGTLFVSSNGTSVRLDCDTRGDSLEHWISRRLRIDPMEVARLEAKYRQSARVPLGPAEAFWEAEPKGKDFW